jgi:D-alanyl-lipoteichoic acid acyltransferase DltB (MBOAT superfamily)
VLPHRAQNVMLLAASYYFYGAWDWRFLSLLWGSTVIDYTCARAIARTEAAAKRRAWLLLSLAFNLGMLGFFKYFNFFAESLQDLFAVFGWQLSVTTLRVILPIGISFYTFMTISYVVDVYRRVYTPTDNLLDFALYVAYFPHLVAGPILRAQKLIPQIQAERVVTGQQIREGLWLIAWGLFQKVYVADNLARVTEGVFSATAQPTGLEVLLGVYAFAFQIFGDFAGYTNIARGTSKLMGIELSINFLYPYFVTSPREFWRHWHISLSEWLRDYLYIPLGGNRGGEWRLQRNIMITISTTRPAVNPSCGRQPNRVAACSIQRATTCTSPW